MLTGGGKAVESANCSYSPPFLHFPNPSHGWPLRQTAHFSGERKKLRTKCVWQNIFSAQTSLSAMFSWGLFPTNLTLGVMALCEARNVSVTSRGCCCHCYHSPLSHSASTPPLVCHKMKTPPKNPGHILANFFLRDLFTIPKV